MSDSIIKQLKKYLLYICVVIFFSSGIHIFGKYLYEGALSEPENGGTVSEAIIGDFPHFNPLVPSSDHNKYINNFLYRSLLSYSPDKQGFERDIASCDLENLLYIRCQLENNIQWSNSQAITSEDIKATFELLRESEVNPIIASLLQNTTIEIGEDYISFSNTKKDINFLQIFLQPILPKEVAYSLKGSDAKGKFSHINGLYSGKFVLQSINQDETVGVTKITLQKNNTYFNNPLLIDFLILNLFDSPEHLLKNKNSFNIFGDNSNIIAGSIPRLEAHIFTLPQFVGLFFNTEVLDLNFRSYLSESISREGIVRHLENELYSEVHNPFFSDTTIDLEQKSDFRIADFMKEQGYYHKTELLRHKFAAKQDALISEESKPSQEVQVKTQQDLKIVTSPTTKKYNFISKDNILIKGSVPSDVEAVYIGDYKLGGFNKGDKEFFYRLLESYDSIIPGENEYKVYFESAGEKELVETFVYVYNQDKEALSKIQETYFEPKIIEVKTPKISSIATSKSEYGSLVVPMSVAVIDSLDDSFYYTPAGEAYSLDLVFVGTDTHIGKSTQKIISDLAKKGIVVTARMMSLQDITVNMRNENFSYDIILLGVDTGHFSSNLYPYFHSSQVKKGYNFSNFKSLSMDILLEELKGNNLSLTKREELESKLLDIMKDEIIIKTLYTPKYTMLADRNLKSFSFTESLPDESLRGFMYDNMYLSEKRTISGEKKSFSGFLQYLLRSLFSH